MKINWKNVAKCFGFSFLCAIIWGAFCGTYNIPDTFGGIGGFVVGMFSMVWAMGRWPNSSYKRYEW